MLRGGRQFIAVGHHRFLIRNGDVEAVKRRCPQEFVQTLGLALKTLIGVGSQTRVNFRRKRVPEAAAKQSAEQSGARFGRNRFSIAVDGDFDLCAEPLEVGCQNAVHAGPFKGEADAFASRLEQSGRSPRSRAGANQPFGGILRRFTFAERFENREPPGLMPFSAESAFIEELSGELPLAGARDQKFVDRCDNRPFVGRHAFNEFF